RPRSVASPRRQSPLGVRHSAQLCHLARAIDAVDWRLKHIVREIDHSRLDACRAERKTPTGLCYWRPGVVAGGVVRHDISQVLERGDGQLTEHSLELRHERGHQFVTKHRLTPMPVRDSRASRVLDGYLRPPFVVYAAQRLEGFERGTSFKRSIWRSAP